MTTHFEKIDVICPHCDHPFTPDEMYACEIDLYALAPKEECAEVECPVCDKEFFVKGGYSPHYTTAFAEELL